jgi:hypothetical protein
MLFVAVTTLAQQPKGDQCLRSKAALAEITHSISNSYSYMERIFVH